MGGLSGIVWLENSVGGALEGREGHRPATALSLRWRSLGRLVGDLFGLRRAGGSRMVEPEPSALADAIVVRARELAVDWGRGGEKDYPDRFSVSVSREAWEAYYVRGAGVSERIASLASGRMPGRPEFDWRPVVLISCSDLVPRGCFEIAASFGLVESGGAPREEGGEVAEGGSRPETTPPIGQTATLRFLSTSYVVRDGSTMGVARQGRDNPDVVLPTCEDLKYTSNVQGGFALDDGCWVFTQRGRNATRVSKRGGGDVVLGQGDSVTLGDRDRLWLPRSTEPVLFVADSRSLTGTPHMPVPR